MVIVINHLTAGRPISPFYLCSTNIHVGSFRIADITKGLEEFEGKFDVIHCRSVAGHVGAFSLLKLAFSLILKTRSPMLWNLLGLLGHASNLVSPLLCSVLDKGVDHDHSILGGVFLSADANKGVFTADKKLCIPASTDGRTPNDGRSWFARWMLEVTDRWTSKGHANTEGDKLSSLIRNDTQFELLGEKAYWSPVNWDGDGVPNGSEIGRLMVLNAIVSHTPQIK